MTDEWNEGVGGVNWIDNEVSLFEDLAKIAGYQFTPLLPLGNLDESNNTVSKIQALLESKDQRYLEGLLCFVNKGGTSEVLAFDIRRRKIKMEALNYLQN